MSGDPPARVRRIDCPPAPGAEWFRTEVLLPCTPVVLCGLSLGACTAAWTAEQLASSIQASQTEVNVILCEPPTGSGPANISRTEQCPPGCPCAAQKNLTFASMSFAEAVRRCSSAAQEHLYLRAEADLDQLFPWLSPEIELQRLENFYPGGAAHCSVFRMSSAQTRLATHFDTMDNMLIQATGSERVVFWPPEADAALYTASGGSKVSAVVEIDQQMQEAFPLFHTVWSLRQECVLHPGEVLYIPALWFHNIASLDFSVSVNTFFRGLYSATQHPPESLYDPTDAFAAKDVPVAADALKAVQAAAEALAALPEPYKSFYAKRAAASLWSNAGLPIETLAPALATPSSENTCTAPAALSVSRGGPLGPSDDDKLRLDQIVMQWAELSPEAPALIVPATGQEHSFVQLAESAAAIAAMLGAHGATHGTYVALLFERGFGQLSAVYGVLMVGAAYIPMDTSHSEDRWQVLLGMSNPVALLAHHTIIPERSTVPLCCTVLHWTPTGPVLCWEAQQAAALSMVDEDGPQENCYVLFTSGTTGKPKGVIVSHRVIRDRLCAYQEMMPLQQPGGKMLYKAPYTFGVSEWEIFWPLMFGRPLVLVEERREFDCKLLTQTIIQQQVTHAFFITSSLRVWLGGLMEVAQLACLEHVIQCGAKLEWVDVQQFQDALLPAAKLHNVYGATESATTIWTAPRVSCSYSRAGAAPAGKPHAGSSAFIVSRDTGALLPRGETGIVAFAGCLATGYLNADELTSQKFVRTVLQPGEDAVLLYNTGDVGVMDHNGSITVLGRADREVRIMGERIDLSDVEAALQKAAHGCHVAVVTGGNLHAHKKCNCHAPKQLVGFVADEHADVEAIRSKMLQISTLRMVPPIILAIQEMPVQSNGKVDWNELSLKADAVSL